MEMLAIKTLLVPMNTGSPEDIDGFVPLVGIEKGYIAASNDYASLFGEGGYVFLFDKDLKLKDEEDDKTLAEFLEGTIETNFLNKLAVFGADWVMYNPNFDCMVYTGIVFSYSPNGELQVKIHS